MSSQPEAKRQKTAGDVSEPSPVLRFASSGFKSNGDGSDGPKCCSTRELTAEARSSVLKPELTSGFGGGSVLKPELTSVLKPELTQQELKALTPPNSVDAWEEYYRRKRRNCPTDTDLAFDEDDPVEGGPLPDRDPWWIRQSKERN